MKTSLDIQALQLFEQALTRPAAERAAWLANQGHPADVIAVAMRLLEDDRTASTLIAETVVMPDPAPSDVPTQTRRSGHADADKPPEFPGVGERLGNYELLKPLEAGGMGVVYLGRRADDVYEQLVAIKLVRPVHLLGAAEFRRQLISRFEDERSILARMSHPNVARILDGGSTAGGIPYLVMEYVDGVSLTDYCRNNRLDVRARLALFSKVCDGVQEAHRHLIVHRDLKPDNILVGANGEPRLLDFGIAKILEQEPLQSNQGTSLSAMTPAYASPEQVRQQALTTSSDVYSLGVVLYQLMAGVRPYELAGLRPAEAEQVVCELQPQPMKKMLSVADLSEDERKRRRDQLTPDVERIVSKAMHKEAGRRYGSAQELADDIRRYLAGEPVLAHPDSAGYRARKFLARHRWSSIAATLAFLGIFSASGVAFWQADRARQAAADMEQVNNFLMDVLKSSDPHNAGSEITMSEAVDAASERVASRFGDRLDLSSKLRFALGYSMISRAKFDMAEREMGLALSESTAAFGADDISSLRIREGIAQLRKEEGRLGEAESMQRDVLTSLEEQGLQADPFYAVALANLGNILLVREDYAAADAVLRQAQALPVVGSAGRAPTDAAVLLGSLAYAAEGLGQTERAEGLYRQAIAELESVYAEGGPELATMLSNLSVLLNATQRPDEAYALRKRSVDMSMASFSRGHPTQIASLIDLSQFARARGDADAALDLARRAKAVADEIYSEAEPLGIYAELIYADELIEVAQFQAANESLARAERDVSTLPAEMKNLREKAAATRLKFCNAPERAISRNRDMLACSDAQ